MQCHDFCWHEVCGAMLQLQPTIHHRLEDAYVSPGKLSFEAMYRNQLRAVTTILCRASAVSDVAR